MGQENSEASFLPIPFDKIHRDFSLVTFSLYDPLGSVSSRGGKRGGYSDLSLPTIVAFSCPSKFEKVQILHIFFL